MKTRLQKWGNSLALRIPKSFAHEAGRKQNSPVEVSLEDGKLVIVAAPKSRLTLRRLLAQVTKDNRLAKFDTRTVMGSEVW